MTRIIAMTDMRFVVSMAAYAFWGMVGAVVWLIWI